MTLTAYMRWPHVLALFLVLSLPTLSVLLGGCAVPVDQDGDGFAAEDGDCDNGDPEVYPGAVEICDDAARDEDCNGLSDDADPGLDGTSTTTFYTDSDGDGYGDSSSPVYACQVPSGAAVIGEDCDDQQASTYPGAEELCDGLDNSCDGAADEEPVDPSAWYVDGDGDGYGDLEGITLGCTVPEGYVANPDDCDDQEALIHPGAPAQCGLDGSGDSGSSGSSGDSGSSGGSGSSDGSGSSGGSGSSDGSEGTGGQTDAIDYDCDGAVEDGSLDEDQDGYQVCDSIRGDDCDDRDASIHPGATEICDGLDNDCDGTVDDPLEAFDADGDGTRDCVDDDLDGWTELEGDCDDRDHLSYPEATEVGDTRDNDCDGEVDEGVSAGEDVDGDGYLWPDDCDDADPTIHPGADEVCEGAGEDPVDNDCDGSADGSDALDAPTWYIDYDHDGFGSSSFLLTFCTQPAGYVSSDDDCDDTDAAVYPSAEEVCDGKDNDCDQVVDDEAVDANRWYEDGDGDGFGAGVPELRCDDEEPAGMVATGGDCDDADGLIHPGADELCSDEEVSPTDNDCDGEVDEGCGLIEGLCTESGGGWDPTQCGDTVCGVWEDTDCDAPSGGCNCGEDRIFVEGAGCLISNQCLEVSPEALCGLTEGTWDLCSGGCEMASCGDLEPSAECAPGCYELCTCPEGAPYWDDDLGCISSSACLEGSCGWVMAQDGDGITTEPRFYSDPLSIPTEPFALDAWVQSCDLLYVEVWWSSCELPGLELFSAEVTDDLFPPGLVVKLAYDEESDCIFEPMGQVFDLSPIRERFLYEGGPTTIQISVYGEEEDSLFSFVYGASE